MVIIMSWHDHPRSSLHHYLLTDGKGVWYHPHDTMTILMMTTMMMMITQDVAAAVVAVANVDVGLIHLFAPYIDVGLEQI